MERILTTPVDTQQHVIAYWITSPVSDEVAHVVEGLQASLQERFSDAFWSAPRDSLHISFNALSPIYTPDKMSNAPTEAPAERVRILEEVLTSVPPIALHFEAVEAHPAAVILRAYDDGSYARLRSEFNKRATLPAGTKPTPNIIHTTIGKFHKAIDLADVQQCLRDKIVDVDMIVTEFEVVRETMLFMLHYEVLRRFALSKP